MSEAPPPPKTWKGNRTDCGSVLHYSVIAAYTAGSEQLFGTCNGRACALRQDLNCEAFINKTILTLRNI